MAKNVSEDLSVAADHTIIRLSRCDSEAFVEALLNPAPPNDRLIETVRRYREAIAAGNLVSVDNAIAHRTSDYFTDRSARADVEKAMEILDRSGCGDPPLPGDELPED